MLQQRQLAALGIVLALASAAASTSAAWPSQDPSAPGAAAVGGGLSDLDALTFSCPKAALNAAAREAAKVRSQGTYQFAFFNIVNDSHHAMYEVHFTSNYEGEPELKYCVAMYCQQGWDPKTTKAEITVMSNTRTRGTAAAHAASCSEKRTPAKPPVKR